MLISKEQFKKAVTMYVDREWMPKATQSQKLITLGATYIILKRVDAEWNKLTDSQLFKVAGIEVIDGKIEVNDVLEAVKYAFDKGGSVNIEGFIFDKSDIDTFERCLHEVIAMGV